MPPQPLRRPPPRRLPRRLQGPVMDSRVWCSSACSACRVLYGATRRSVHRSTLSDPSETAQQRSLLAEPFRAGLGMKEPCVCIPSLATQLKKKTQSWSCVPVRSRIRLLLVTGRRLEEPGRDPVLVRRHEPGHGLQAHDQRVDTRGVQGDRLPHRGPLSQAHAQQAKSTHTHNKKQAHARDALAAACHSLPRLVASNLQ